MKKTNRPHSGPRLGPIDDAMRVSIQQAARLIREGKLVAFPTETVYGLGANALDAVAVGRIFAAKGRPSSSPLIVHVDSIERARELVTVWPETAQKLAERFWPGPLTLVLPKRPVVPDTVTAGLETVGVRMPDHPVALELIRVAGVPIAAPSANPFTWLSPTKAEHVRAALRGRVDYVIDGGAAPVGIESTVLSLVSGAPVLLRPGAVSREQIEAVVGRLGEPARNGPTAAHPSPGLHRQHYAPRTPLVLVGHGRLPAKGRGAYLWFRTPAEAEKAIRMPATPAEYAARLYRLLHELDGEGWDWIAVEAPPESTAWEAVRDRLQRASRR